VNKYYEIFKRNFPFVVRAEDEALAIINNFENKIFEEYDGDSLIACSIVHKNTILLLCVDDNYRNKGIGSKLLTKSEEFIKSSGYNSVNVGVGDNYLMPGVPMATKAYTEVLNEENIYNNVNDQAYLFFLKRGYFHSWNNANCFDMRADLENYIFPNINIGDTIDGIYYRFASINDIPSIIKCTIDAEESFSKYYQNKILYEEDSKQKVLVAIKNNEICGTLMVSIETEGEGLGSVGCKNVMHKFRDKHIGVNMVIMGTKYLKSRGLKNAFLGYTYSGLDKMYGYAGYRICIYYFMAQKKLNPIN